MKSHSHGDTGAVVKANAYGMGIEEATAILSSNGCRHYFVATTEEGLQLCNYTGDSIYVMGVPDDIDAVRQLGETSLIPVLATLRQIEAWKSTTSRSAVVYFNTGMNRLGLNPKLSDDPSVRELPKRLLMTHLACADNRNSPFNQVQVNRFADVCMNYPDVATTIGNSAGILLGPETQGDVSRPGIGLYGGNPFINEANPMLPVMTWLGPVLAVDIVRQGEAVGYGGSFVADHDMPIAVVGIGYADGLSRSLSNRFQFLFGEQKLPILGRVSMDLTIIDISEATEINPGDYVEVFGENQSIDVMASAQQTIDYEIFTSIGGRTERIYD